VTSDDFSRLSREVRRIARSFICVAPSVAPTARARTDSPVGCDPDNRTEVIMSPRIPPGESAGTMTPAGREARWALSVRFAIEAASEAEARAILGQALTGFDRELPLQGEPTIAPSGAGTVSGWPRSYLT
jgi:hypothetical protein